MQTNKKRGKKLSCDDKFFLSDFKIFENIFNTCAR